MSSFLSFFLTETLSVTDKVSVVLEAVSRFFSNDSDFPGIIIVYSSDTVSDFPDTVSGFLPFFLTESVSY